MEKRHFPDQYARKLIADGLQRLYRADETVPENLLDLVKILDGGKMGASDDAKGHHES